MNMVQDTNLQVSSVFGLSDNYGTGGVALSLSGRNFGNHCRDNALGNDWGSGEPDPETLSATNIGNIATPVLRAPDYDRSNSEFRVLQKWQGYVLSIGSQTFSARLQDLTAQTQQEEFEFSIDDIPDEDQKLLRPGAVFYWKIGYLDARNGQRYRTSDIRFRRRPCWNQQELDSARNIARKWESLWTEKI